MSSSSLSNDDDDDDHHANYEDWGVGCLVGWLAGFLKYINIHKERRRGRDEASF